MTTVAVIGLGIMGGPMAANLVKAGFDVVGYNRSPDKVQALADAGGRGAGSVADAPGRNEPGTGKLDIDSYLRRIAATGYDGWVGLEYKPTGASADAFDWLPREQRSAR